MFTYVIHVKAGIDNKSPLWLKYVVTGDVDQLQIFSNQNRTLFLKFWYFPLRDFCVSELYTTRPPLVELYQKGKWH